MWRCRNTIGAALLAYYRFTDKERIVNPSDSMKGAYLGPKFSNTEVKNYLNKINASYSTFADSELFEKISEHIAEGKVVGWFNGAMEFGPRALGARSIIGDPRNKDMQSVMNLKLSIEKALDLLLHLFLRKMLQMNSNYIRRVLICL